MTSYFIQDLIHPYVGVVDLKPTLLPDLQITDEDKEYLKQYLLLNVFFHNFNDQWKNLGLAYYTVRNYFTANDDFIIVDDPDRSLYVKASAYINEVFNGLQVRVPLVYPEPSKQLIIQSYDDLFNKEKVLNTAVYLLLKYSMFKTSITVNISQPQTVGFSGGQS